MAAYYNEWDAFCCAWQRELIVDGLIAPGFVDQTDVRLVRGELLRHFNQWHLFSGIAVWSAALRMAGWADDREVLTVSCPCQPFSSAGKRKGTDDERHLWPYAMQIIREIKPAVIFGEQVWSADTVGAVGKRKPQRAGSLSPEAAHRPTWLHDVQAQLEAEGYTFGAVGIPACGFGAPHIRQRLYFCGIRQRRTVDLPALAAWPTPSRLGVAQGDSDEQGSQGRQRVPECADQRAAGPRSVAGGLADTCCEGIGGWRVQRPGEGDGAGDGATRERPAGLRADGRLDNPTSPRLNGQECDPEGLARDEARLRLSGAGCTTERLGDPCCAASERHAGSLLAPEEGKHGAGVAVDGAVSERLEHASPGMGGLAQPMHTERRSFSEPGQDGRDGQDCGREEAHSEPGTCGEVRGLSDTELYGSPRRALPGSSGATVTARQPGRQQAVNDGELARGRVDALAGQSQPGPTNGLWAAADWLYCRDDKWRPSIPSHEPVADDGAAVEAVADLCGAGILAEEGPAQGLVLYHPLAPAGAFKNRVHELKGAGNALCIAQAAEFIAAVMAEIDEGAV